MSYKLIPIEDSFYSISHEIYTWLAIDLLRCVAILYLPIVQGDFNGPRQFYESGAVLKYTVNAPDSKVHGANMGPIWGRQDPDGPNVGPMNFALWASYEFTINDDISMFQ